MQCKVKNKIFASGIGFLVLFNSVAEPEPPGAGAAQKSGGSATLVLKIFYGSGSTSYRGADQEPVKYLLLLANDSSEHFTTVIIFI